MLHHSRTRRVLWGQRLSHYVPPVRYAGWVNGVPLLRHEGAHPPSSFWTTGKRKEQCSNIATFARVTQKDYFPSAAPPLYVEDVNEPLSLAQVTPVDLPDVALTVQYLQHQQQERGREASAAGTTAAAALQRLAEVVAEHRMVLAGAESLQTGLPLAATLTGLDCAVRDVRRASCLSARPPSPPSVAATPSVALCMTPSYHSLAWGLRALAALLLSPSPREVLWLPAEGASLSALWLMYVLHQGTKQLAPVPRFPFHVLLTGDVRRHVLPLLDPSGNYLGNHRSDTSDHQCGLVTYGWSEEAVRGLAREMPRNASFSPLQTQHLQVAVLTQEDALQKGAPGAEKNRQHIASYLFRHGLCHTGGGSEDAAAPCVLAQRPSSVAVAAAKAPLLGPTVSLLLVPQSVCLPLLQALVQELSDRHAAVGHSLDATSLFGPLRSAAHRATAAAVLRAAVAGEDGGGRVQWRHVAGGFTPPMVASRGFYYVPAILYTSVNAECGDDINAIQEVLRSVAALAAPLRADFETTAGSVFFVCSVGMKPKEACQDHPEKGSGDALVQEVQRAARRLEHNTLHVLTLRVAPPS